VGSQLASPLQTFKDLYLAQGGFDGSEIKLNGGGG
jgi:hypothetical protein